MHGYLGGIDVLYGLEYDTIDNRPAKEVVWLGLKLYELAGDVFDESEGAGAQQYT